jgi:hypothetical protein
MMSGFEEKVKKMGRCDITKERERERERDSKQFQELDPQITHI